MSQTTTPSGADVLAWIAEQVRLFFPTGHRNSIHAAHRKGADYARTAVESMIAREAALVARNAELEAQTPSALREKLRSCEEAHAALVAERDALIAENLCLSQQKKIWERARHNAASERDVLKKMWQQAEEDVKALREDAERYRFIRNPSHETIPAVWISGKGNAHIESEWLTDAFADTAIDAARAEAGHG